MKRILALGVEMATRLLCGAMAAVILLCPAASVGEQPATKTQAQTSPAAQLDNTSLAIMIKSTLTAVQHANATGNYSVLRDLGTPIFRERYDQARLTAIFGNLRARGINLSPTLMLMPNLSKQPEVTAQGQLHLIGNFSTQPLQIQFELLYLQLDGIWRLDGIAVDAIPATQAHVAATPKGGKSSR